MALASIGHELPDLAKKLRLSSDLLFLERAWDVEIGHLCEFAHIAALDNGALVIEVDNHSAMQEISLRRRELVRKINKHLPVPMIQHIQVRITPSSYGR